MKDKRLDRDMDEKEFDSASLTGSKVVKEALRAWGGISRGLSLWYSRSLASKFFNLARDKYYYTPARIIGGVILTTVITNILLLAVLRMRISVWGWFMRTLFIIAALVCLMCGCDWLTLRETSLFLKKRCHED